MQVIKIIAKKLCAIHQMQSMHQNKCNHAINSNQFYQINFVLAYNLLIFVQKMYNGTTKRYLFIEERRQTVKRTL